MRLSHCDTCGQCTHPKKHGTGLINKLALHVGLQDRRQQQGLGIWKCRVQVITPRNMAPAGKLLRLPSCPGLPSM